MRDRSVPQRRSSPRSRPKSELRVPGIELGSLCQDVSEKLWKVKSDGGSGSPYLIFPKKRDGSTRVSEQESKINFFAMVRTARSLLFRRDAHAERFHAKRVNSAKRTHRSDGVLGA